MVTGRETPGRRTAATAQQTGSVGAWCSILESEGATSAEMKTTDRGLRDRLPTSPIEYNKRDGRTLTSLPVCFQTAPPTAQVQVALLAGRESADGGRLLCPGHPAHGRLPLRQARPDAVQIPARPG